MSNAATEAQVAAARAYESLHVPALFRQWAPVMLDTAEWRPGQHLLDVACGTGVLAREAWRRRASDGAVAGIDLDAGMITVAREQEPAIDWRVGSAESLPFPDRSFDVVACQFGLMFFPDREAALAEMWRVLSPGGRLVLAVWDRLENAQAYPEEVALLERRAGQAAADALRAPFVLGALDGLQALLHSAGVASPLVETRVGRARFPSIRTMVEADLRGWLPLMGVHLDENRIELILREADEALSGYVDEAGHTDFEAPAHIVVARRD